MNYINQRLGEAYCSCQRRINTPVNLPITEKIETIICDYHCVTMDDIIGKRRRTALNEARRLLYFFVRSKTNATLEDMGERYKRTHSQIMSGLRILEQNYDVDKFLRKKIENIETLYEHNRTIMHNGYEIDITRVGDKTP